MVVEEGTWAQREQELVLTLRHLTPKPTRTGSLTL